jgi:hypothetical protein
MVFTLITDVNKLSTKKSNVNNEVDVNISSNKT